MMNLPRVFTLSMLKEVDDYGDTLATSTDIGVGSSIG